MGRRLAGVRLVLLIVVWAVAIVPAGLLAGAAALVHALRAPKTVA